MSVRQKYAFNGICFFENAREHIEANDFPDIPIGTVGGIDEWVLTMRHNASLGFTYYKPFIYTPVENPHLKHRYYFGILRDNDKSELASEPEDIDVLEPGYGIGGIRKEIDDWLDEEDNFLTDGGIRIEFGFQIEGIRGPDEIWTFNFYDPLFDAKGKGNMITFYKDLENGEKKHFYSHKQLLTFHSTYFNSDSYEMTEIDNLDDLLQICHGVRGKINYDSAHHTLKHARKYNLFNVIHIVDQGLLWETPLQLSDAISLDAFNAVWFFQNAREHMERDDFPRISIGTIGGIAGWYLTMRFEIINNEAGYDLFIHTYQRKTMLKYRVYFNILKNDGSSETPYECSGYLEPTFGPCGKRKTIGNWLDEENRYLTENGYWTENGYLTDGVIGVQFGLQIEGILNEDGIWTFNFHDILFDSRGKTNMITFYKDFENGGWKIVANCHKQLITFHSTYFNLDSNKKIETDNLDDLLQICHGVRGKINYDSAHHTLKHARKYNLFNVIHIVDQALLWDSSLLISDAISLGLNHYLADLLRKQESLEELAEELKKVDLETMSGEMMKKCVMFMLDF
uniref:BTB domain-containing protein n=1 Tax=Caenorhabditis tropicalis TaxID=1561998 RepID=A0A1I7UDM6_9PELO